MAEGNEHAYMMYPIVCYVGSHQGMTDADVAAIAGIVRPILDQASA